ncbi:MAG: thioredoxin [Saprospiraceae bacterium]|nr:thioredoxin [Saprospiraceae bacterium]
MAQTLTDGNFKTEVLEKNGVALIDFWAEWCGPCRMIGPIIEELSSEYKNKATIGKVNVDENSEVTMEYEVRSIPTLLFFKNGQLVDRHVGATSKKVLTDKLDALMS